ncbi:hemagglutinin [Striga asiatica]|uniref:Hemagglutinin n=1 Tax=Striga asiatica TaxID=4170 RepID=A0A5A7PKJ7_STRAF|nr:hemagglutinin [Striga asiatica]
MASLTTWEEPHRPWVSLPEVLSITWKIAWRHSLVLIIENANVMAPINGIGFELGEVGRGQRNCMAVEANKKSPTTQRTFHILEFPILRVIFMNIKINSHTRKAAFRGEVIWRSSINIQTIKVK